MKEDADTLHDCTLQLYAFASQAGTAATWDQVSTAGVLIAEQKNSCKCAPKQFLH